MPRTRIKICGITRPDDAQKAAELGADAIGLNFVGGPRQISAQTAYAISLTLHDEENRPATLDTVALCTSEKLKDNSLAMYEVREKFSFFNVYQVYGPRFDDFVHSPFLAVMREKWWMVNHFMNRESLVNAAVAVGMLHSPPTAILLDTASPEKLGGTGQSFNWHWIAEARAAGELDGLPPIILAGGLTPDNVADAIRIARPYAVDVSSGVEVPGHPGIKDPLKIRDFIQAVRGTDTP